MADSYLIEDVPRDVEADILAGLARFGITASTEVRENREAGDVRVSRTGGALAHNHTRDRPEVLIEVWGADGVDAFDSALRVYAAFRIWGNRGEITPGVVIHDVDADVPRTRDDELAPDLHRVQFVVTFMAELTTVELIERNA